MKTYELIALDMDGTLLTDEKIISETTKKMIEKAVKQGKYVVLSTGRSLDELKDNETDLAAIRYYICESGALIYDCQEDTILHVEQIPETYVKQIMDIVKEEDVMIYYDNNGRSISEQEKINHMDHYHMGQYQDMLKRCIVTVDHIIDHYNAHPCGVEKLNLFSASEKIRERLYQRLKKFPLPMVYAEETSLEISPQNVSKATGLQKLCEHLGLSIEQTIAVGDSDNDLEILKAAGLSVAMENGKAHIKEICDVIVADNNHDGCAEAIEKFLL